MNEATEPRARIPGVRYKRVTRHRMETTVIDGVPSSRRVAYKDWEPQPPHDWDEVILRGITAVAIAFTLIAVAATTASVGGLLSKMVPPGVAYAMGAVFTLAWLYCLGIEWLNRIAPDRARPAMIAGWVALLISMGAVFAYGHSLGQPWAGGFGACIDLLAKGSWWLLLRQHAVPLDAGVGHWVTDQEQKLASRELLSNRLLRLNRRAAYQRAIGGPEFQAATAILAAAETAPAEPSGQRPDTTVRADAPAPDTVPAPAPAAPASPPAPPAAPVPPVSAPTDIADEDVPDTPGQSVPPLVADISRPSIASIIRAEIDADRTVSDDALHAAVLRYHPDRPNLRDTVRRTALRHDPKRTAS